MIKKICPRSGTVANLVLACILTLMITSTAILLNNMHRALVVPAAAQIKADYQMESVIVMEMQKIRNDSNNNQKKFNFSKEISPGYFLILSSEQVSDDIWHFDISLNGPGFTRNLKARASKKFPDRIFYQHNSG